MSFSADQFTVLVHVCCCKWEITIKSHTLQQFNDSEEDIAKFFNTMMFEIGCAHTKDIAPNSFQKPGILKTNLCRWLSQTCHFLCDRRSDIDSLRQDIGQLFSENDKLLLYQNGRH